MIIYILYYIFNDLFVQMLILVLSMKDIYLISISLLYVKQGSADAVMISISVTLSDLLLFVVF